MTGCLNETMKMTFVEEVERVANDPIYWVRREACFALGALAKVVPQEVVVLSLVRDTYSLFSSFIPHS